MKCFNQLQVIVKSGDDCRQEHLAVQLVAHLYGKKINLTTVLFSFDLS